MYLVLRAPKTHQTYHCRQIQDYFIDFDRLAQVFGTFNQLNNGQIGISVSKYITGSKGTFQISKKNHFKTP